MIAKTLTSGFGVAGTLGARGGIAEVRHPREQEKQKGDESPEVEAWVAERDSRLGHSVRSFLWEREQSPEATTPRRSREIVHYSKSPALLEGQLAGDDCGCSSQSAFVVPPRIVAVAEREVKTGGKQERMLRSPRVNCGCAPVSSQVDSLAA